MQETLSHLIALARAWIVAQGPAQASRLSGVPQATLRLFRDGGVTRIDTLAKILAAMPDSSAPAEGGAP